MLTQITVYLLHLLNLECRREFYFWGEKNAWAVNVHSNEFLQAHWAPHLVPGASIAFSCWFLKNPMKWVHLLLLPFYTAGNWGSQTFRDQPKFWSVRDGARFGPRSLGFQNLRPILAPEEGIRRHYWEDFKIFKFSSLFLLEKPPIQNSNNLTKS